MDTCNKLGLCDNYEYHFGAWRDKAQDLFETDDSQEASYQSTNFKRL